MVDFDKLLNWLEKLRYSEDEEMDKRIQGIEKQDANISPKKSSRIPPLQCEVVVD